MQALYALHELHATRPNLPLPLEFQSKISHLFINININKIVTMSSPSHRRQRSSQSGTPKRTSQRNSSQALPSSPPDPAAAQLHNEAASQGNGTPRRGPPSSSPMNYRSSPADIARANRERDVSSPLRQMTNTQTTGDGDRTPRASGLIGGMYAPIL